VASDYRVHGSPRAGQRLPRFFTDPDHDAYLIYSGGTLAGFCLTRAALTFSSRKAMAQRPRRDRRRSTAAVRPTP